MRKTILAMVVLLFVSSMTFGQFQDGNELYRHLFEWEKNGITIENSFNVGTVFGYVTGVYETFATNLLDRPANVTTRQLIDVVIKYFKEHPEERHEGANVLVKRAILEAWPKKKRPNKKGK